MNSLWGAGVCLLLFASAGCEHTQFWICSDHVPAFAEDHKTYLGEAKLVSGGSWDPCQYEFPDSCWGTTPHEEGALCPDISPWTKGCAGECIAEPPRGWSLALVVTDALVGVADCPDNMVNDLYFLDPPQETNCVCPCVPSGGSCVLSSTLTASTAPCSNIPGGTSFSFDALAPWNGACSAENPLPASKSIQSVTIEPLTLTEGDCKRLDPTAPPRPGSWDYGRALRACHVVTSREGCDAPLPLCVAKFPGLLTCIHRPLTDEMCPEGWPNKQVAFTDRGGVDARTCSTCECSGKPTKKESECRAEVSIYENNVCSGDPLFLANASSNRALCTDVVVSDPALLSKSAAPPVYIPGECDDGIGPAGGELDPGSMQLFCCLPEKVIN